MEEPKHKQLPVDRFYDGRRCFSIIGLTGMAGSGCSTLARYMSSRAFLDQVRKPESILIDEYPQQFEDNEFSFQNDKQGVGNKAVGGLVFKQKYSICYEFAHRFYKEYIILKYTHVLWLYVLLSAKNRFKKCAPDTLIGLLCNLLVDMYHPSYKKGRDDDYKTFVGFDEGKHKNYVSYVLSGYKGWAVLCEKLNQLPRCYIDDLDDSQKDIKELAAFIKVGSIFEEFVTYLLNTLAEGDYYYLCFLHHRLAVKIRKCGNPFATAEEDNLDNNECLYNVVKLINIIIKGIKHSNGEECRVVIDSLRNSLEARYFKERYTAFYLICVNDSESREIRLQNSIRTKMSKTKESQELLDAIVEKVKQLTEVELKNKDFSKGKFASPDVENVIADAEIHISNQVEQGAEEKDPRAYDFLSMAEQWMKYSSLILHPGLITPSAEERCMVVAYTAKFNSSCLSRQVGAVITNQYHSIRTIGWNEVPYGQIPCGLRELHLINSVCNDCRHVYSEFERGPHREYGNKTFKDKVDDSYPALGIDIVFDENGEPIKKEKPGEISGYPFSYCFKSLHNTFEGEKNQVYTRSLHAEENAILQMAKYGGEPLMNGIIYVTASPCELCAKKLYQIGVRKIVYIDPYPGISMNQIVRAGFKRPRLKLFQGAYGASYFKLYQPFMPYKDELGIRLECKPDVQSKNDLLEAILEKLKVQNQPSYTKEEIDRIVAAVPEIQGGKE